MKKWIVTAFAVGMMTFTSVSAFAATSTTKSFVCPNGNEACVENGECLNNGDCINHENCNSKKGCIYKEACNSNEKCQYQKISKKSTNTKRDGTGYHHGERGRSGHHRGNHNR